MRDHCLGPSLSTASSIQSHAGTPRWLRSTLPACLGCSHLPIMCLASCLVGSRLHSDQKAPKPGYCFGAIVAVVVIVADSSEGFGLCQTDRQ